MDSTEFHGDSKPATEPTDEHLTTELKEIAQNQQTPEEVEELRKTAELKRANGQPLTVEEEQALRTTKPVEKDGRELEKAEKFELSADVRTQLIDLKHSSIAELDRLNYESRAYERFQNDITDQVATIFRRVEATADPNRQLDRMAMQVANDIGVELISRDNVGEVASTGKNKQLARSLETIEEDFRDIKNRVNVSFDTSLTSQQLPEVIGSLETVSSNILTLARNIHEDQRDVIQILTAEADYAKNSLESFRGLQIYQQDLEKSEAVATLVNRVEMLDDYIRAEVDHARRIAYEIENSIHRLQETTRQKGSKIVKAQEEKEGNSATS